MPSSSKAEIWGNSSIVVIWGNSMALPDEEALRVDDDDDDDDEQTFLCKLSSRL
jgi:hypothetical protein